MAHQAIYRKWRPVTFDDIVGQQHITKTLKNQILSGNIGHAYLFCGTRGTGKTTCAKVLARAVNCLNPQNGNPCNECEVCRGIADGSIMDVTEMDAASNNGVEDIRSIKDDINYTATNARYTVYIIDEVHMLSTSAFNALLKTLEEPPENVIFILASTEAHKVPQTILSRCQRFDFRRIRNEDIIVRMKEIAHADGYEITDGAYRMLASLADGSLRDGLSIMERVISAGGNSVSEEDITAALGISSLDCVFELTDAIIDGDSSAVIEIIDRVLSEGKDLTQLANSMLSHLRTLMICRLTDKPEDLVDTDAQTMVRYISQSEGITFEKINHASSLLSKAISDARTAKSVRIIYELAFIKLARPETDRTPEGMMDELKELEKKLDGAVPFRQTQPKMSPPSSEKSDILKRLEALESAVSSGTAALKPPAEDKKKQEKKKLSHRLYVPIPPEELNYDYPTAKLARNWNKTIETMLNRGNVYAVPLKNCTVTFDAEGIIILVPDKRDDFTQRLGVNHIESIRESFRLATGSDYTLKIVKRSDFDEDKIISAFDLPHTSVSSADETETEYTADETEGKSGSEDKLGVFIERFSGIITDGDRIPQKFDREREAGEQSVIEDIEDDKEEFLEENELPSDEDDL